VLERFEVSVRCNQKAFRNAEAFHSKNCILYARLSLLFGLDANMIDDVFYKNYSHAET